MIAIFLRIKNNLFSSHPGECTIQHENDAPSKCVPSTHDPTA